MRKDIVLPGLAVGCGVLGFGLRRWQWTAGYDPATQLFTKGHPAVYALVLLLAVLAAVLLVSLRSVPKPQAGADPFRCPSSGYMAMMAASALLYLGGGVLGLLEGMDQMALWRAAPGSHQLTYPIALILCALLSLAAGPATLMLGKAGYRGDAAPSLSLLVNFPAMAALAWVFASHLANGTNPVLLSYGVPLAAAVFLLLAHYYTAAFFHDRPHPFRFAFTALLGTAFGLASPADGLSPFYLALTAACALSALANAWVMLRNAFGPPWPEPSETRDEDDEDDEPDF